MRRILLALLILTNLSFGLTPAMASAASFKNDACDGLSQLGGNPCANGGSGATNKINSTVGSVVSILSLVVGIVAVIMIIVAGFKYITSNGDSGSISSAKTTLIYALVGLVVAALAQFLVHFVLNKVTSP